MADRQRDEPYDHSYAPTDRDRPRQRDFDYDDGDYRPRERDVERYRNVPPRAPRGPSYRDDRNGRPERRVRDYRDYDDRHFERSVSPQRYDRRSYHDRDRVDRRSSSPPVPRSYSRSRSPHPREPPARPRGEPSKEVMLEGLPSDMNEETVGRPYYKPPLLQCLHR
ncbi:MAG: hypothetical protein M1831_002810 [Alyxoria varia]|nr:MAG: hypothetical protein M1831_002810 [Alyxoria varia]